MNHSPIQKANPSTHLHETLTNTSLNTTQKVWTTKMEVLRHWVSQSHCLNPRNITMHASKKGVLTGPPIVFVPKPSLAACVRPDTAHQGRLFLIESPGLQLAGKSAHHQTIRPQHTSGDRQ